MQRVMIVEDNELIALALRTMLEASGFGVEHHAEGRAAVAAACAEPPDIIILDMRLPDVDGDEVCRLLRADGRTRNVRVLMLSANTHAAFRDQARDAGVDLFMAKPFRAPELVAAVRSLAASSPGHRP